MFKFDVRMIGLSETVKSVMNLPGNFQKAKTAAFKSAGWMVATELRNHIEYGGTNWPPLHPLTLRWRKHRAAPKTPLYWLGRFSRYRVSDDGDTLGIGLGRSNAGKPGQIDDPWLAAATRRHEAGSSIPVTKRMRLKWISTKHKGVRYRKLRSNATLGGYCVLRPETTHLTIPPRRFMGPVFRKVEPKVGPWFEKKFWPAFGAYASGSSPSKIRDVR